MHEIEYRTVKCPIPGCSWSVTSPYTRGLATFSTLLSAGELLAHLTGRRVIEATSFPQERIHIVRELEDLGLEAILEAAGISVAEKAVPA